MNSENEKKQSSIEQTVEVLLGSMAFNSNMPIIYVEDQRSLEPKMIGIRKILLPIGGVDYITTINYIANISPECNDRLLEIGIDIKDEQYDRPLLHSEVVKYLANNDIPFKMDITNKNWEIDFPDDTVKKLIDSEYKCIMENTKKFYDRFYCENLILRLREIGDFKSRQLFKS